MQQYQNVIQDKFGNVIVGASVAVYVYGTTTPATIYSGNGTGLLPSNTVTTNSPGEFAFYAANGRYSLTVTATNFVAENYSDFILYDPADLTSPAASGVAFTPFGAIAATNVQNAIQEVVTDLAASSGSSLVGFLQTGTSAVARTVQNKFRESVSVLDFGADATGVSNSQPAIQAAIDSISATGGDVYFPAGTYLVNTAIRAKANTTLYGDGYASKIMCPAGGWTLSSTDIYGIITAKNADNVKITGLYIYGTKTQAIGQTPKLVYYENAENLTVSYNYLENTAFEGIWSGGSGLDSPRFSITNNRIDNVGWPAGTYAALPAIQTNGYDGIIANNTLNNVGTGIGASGAFTIVSNNVITGIRLDGIATGDNGEAAVGSGITTIIGNLIEYTADPAISGVYYAIRMGGSSGVNRQINCTGNTIKIIGMAGVTSGRGIHISTSENIIVSNNTIEIDSRGYGINIDNSAVNRTVFISNNVIKFNSEIAPSYGVIALCAAANTLNIISSNNFVSGLSVAGSSYGYDYPQQGTMNVTIQGDVMTGGYFRAGNVNIGDGSFNNNPIYLKKDYSAITALMHRPQIAMLNLQPALGGSNYVIASGALTITGTVASANKNLSRINVDTEGAAATDDLDTITGGVSGDILILAAANSTRTVVCKDGTGNMSLAGDFSMDNTQDRIVLMYEGTTWFELCRSDNGA